MKRTAAAVTLSLTVIILFIAQSVNAHTFHPPEPDFHRVWKLMKNHEPGSRSHGNPHPGIVKIEQGFIQSSPPDGFPGFPMNATEYFGIPYAAPPVGPLRWIPPQPPAHFQGVFVADGSLIRSCAQPDGAGGINGDENCLYLNVYVPDLPQPRRGFPVMLWIHGGGLTTGNGWSFDPAPLVEQGVIVVTINYRLGYFGFFAHPAIDAEHHAHGNYGLMDQQFALKWVQKNIEAFGGDADRVTIFGESAGGESVYSNLASPTANGLFHRAIAESGAAVEFQDYYDFIVPLAQGETAGTSAVPSGVSIAASVGCADQTAQCLRNVPQEVLGPTIVPNVNPFVDGKVLAQTPTDAFASGHFNRVPVISGSNHDEWRLFIAFQYDDLGNPLTDADYPDAVASLDGLSVADPFVQNLVNTLYPLSSYPPPAGVSSAPLALGALGTDQVFACPERNSVKLLSKYVPTFAYEFSDENAPSIDPSASFPLGAYHFAEVPYLFEFGFPFTPDQQQLSDTMVGYWTHFAANGNPNFDNAPLWSSYNSLTDNFQNLIPPTPMVETTFDSDHKCSAFWNTF